MCIRSFLKGKSESYLQILATHKNTLHKYSSAKQYWHQILPNIGDTINTHIIISNVKPVFLKNNISLRYFLCKTTVCVSLEVQGLNKNMEISREMHTGT